ncbi:MAG TPA: right-handed parallel beta-helix repeat-containing protein [Sedimentisphaerales bacterium]|nr:right-handed parallel beta-helix repeat-containing protein [Sedimentisphaerales bacterium]
MMRKIGGLVIAAAFMTLASTVLAAERWVPAEYPTIQAAINDANNGDEIVVADGLYTGPGNRDIDFNGLAITVRSQNGPTNCIIDCNGSSSDKHRGFIFQNGEGLNSVLCGLTIINGYGKILDGEEYSAGGAILCKGSGPTIINCIFSNNSAGMGGGVFCNAGSNPKVINCIFEENSAGTFGGAFMCFAHATYPFPELVNCTLTDNDADKGGGIALLGTVHDYGSVSVRNSIIWNNTPTNEPGIVTPICCKCGCVSLYVDYTILQIDWQGVYGSHIVGTGNVIADPCFADPCNGDYHLRCDSACIDAGDPNYVGEPNETDMDGNPRVVAGRIDMGAYEFQGVIYVDDDAPGDPGPGDPNVSDPLENGTEAHPFDTIQEAMGLTRDGYRVVVLPGLYLQPDPWYPEEINFNGKNVTLTSIDPTNSSTVSNTVIRGIVQFGGTEDPNCLLTGFTISDICHGVIWGNHTHATVSHCVISGNGPCGATVIRDCDGTIRNCLIAGNMTIYLCGIDPVIVSSGGLIKNCTIANNISGIGVVAGGTTTIENCIIYYNNEDANNPEPQINVGDGGILDLSYCDLEGLLIGISGNARVKIGLGIIDEDPCFVRPGYCVDGNYRLKSAGWRLSEDGPFWVHDDVTSLCIDAGNPGSPLRDELPRVLPDDPNNEYGVNVRINMGAYGGTAEASMGPPGWALLADLNNGGTVNPADLAAQLQYWLESGAEQPGDLNRDGMVDLIDYAMLAAEWREKTSWANLPP